ncbi:MAG: hypothetical protein JST84_02745 [Acidobacteria bacterium]|nr:hypothetical protein [Acidobacteriota bacterium]
MWKYKFELSPFTSRGKLTRGLLLASLWIVAVGSLNYFSLTIKAADGTFSLGGNAEITDSAPNPPHPRAIQLTSTCAGRCLVGPLPVGELTTASVIYMPDHTLKFKDIHTLGVDFRKWRGDCGGGSPRFEIALDGNNDGIIDGSVFIYLGPLYNYNRCSNTWESTGNLMVGGGDERFDLTQFFRGVFYDTWRNAISLVGEYAVCYILLVEDGAWYPGLDYPFGNLQNYQVFHFDNVRVNNDLLSTRGNAPSLAPPRIPTLARQALEEYLTGVSKPRDLFGINSYYGRRYSWTNILRSGFLPSQRRGLQNRDASHISR